MANSATETIIGAVVIVAAAGFLTYAGTIAGVSTPTGSYELTASFRSIEGVSLGTDVRLAGVKVGTVTGLELNRENYRAEARFTILEGIEIPDDSAVNVSSEGLLGGNFVEIIPGGSEFALDQGEEIYDTQGAVSLISLLLKFVSGQNG